MRTLLLGFDIVILYEYCFHHMLLPMREPIAQAMITGPYDGSISHVDIPNMFFVMASNLTSLLHIPQINRSCYSRTTLLQIPVQNIGCRAKECGTYCYGFDET